MKRLIMKCLVAAAIFMALPASLHAAMDSYCSAPPYVTRTIAPNIMVLMDNSNDMYNPAHTAAYSSSTTYMGYFKSGACYKYSSNKFVEQQKTGAAPSTCSTANCYTSYTTSDTCPATAPFRGNLLNWATMSRFDVLQKVLIGGNAVSKQGNAHTLISVSNNWGTDKAGAGANNDVYGNCEFLVNGGSLTIKDVTASSCTLLDASPAPIAFSEEPARAVFAWLSGRLEGIYSMFSHGVKSLLASASGVWNRIEFVAKAWASHTLSIGVYSGVLSGTVGIPYSLTLECSGTGATCPNGTYNWSFTGLPAWLSVSYTTVGGNRVNLRATLSGTPTTAGSYSFTATLSLAGHTNGTANYTITITPGPLTITTASITGGGVGTAYYQTLIAMGGTTPYTWSATGLPPGLSISTDAVTYEGIISGTPTTAGTYSVTVTVTDNSGTTANRTYSVVIAAASALRSAQYTIKVELVEESFTDLNGNDIWDSGETYTDFNGSGQWEGKQGVFQKYWDTIKPKARWGMAKFGTGGSVDIDACIPHSPAASFYTRVQNAQPTTISPLAKGLYGLVNYFGFNSSNFSSYVSGSYSGCTNSDPIDTVPCRKNFILVISSGSNVTGSNFSDTSCTAATPNDNDSAPLVQNACFGFNTDLRSDKSGKQNVYTYVVNTMGTANNAILEDAAKAGGGNYYLASNSSDLEEQLNNAFTDILAKAASGTAVSVLTTSSRGIGSMVQAYFLPTKQVGPREVTWTGYLQNLWIDPKDNLREDTINDYILKLAEDNVLKLHFDESTNETKAATFTTDANGNGGTLASCSTPTIKAFSDVSYLWESGKKLALTAPSARTLFTSNNILRTSGTSPITTTTTTFTNNAFTTANITNNTSACSGLSGETLTRCNALDRDATYSYSSDVSNIVRYIRGECLETGVSGDTGCGSTAGGTYRDRRINVTGGDANGNVWKLGDIISSTPKVLANTPTNTYHIDYGDSTYYNYISSDSYKQRSSIAFVGANDGILHAFRVGYLKDTGLAADTKAAFQDTYADTTTDELGEEVWGYIPFNAFPYLKYLASTGYCHIYYNDLSVRIIDASLGGTHSDHDEPTDTRIYSSTDSTKRSWKTILIGGMRFGGACTGGVPTPPATVTNVGYSAYYAIDVTDPENPVPLWEFSDEDMGYATTFPSVIRTGATNTNGYWYAVFGSGSKQLPKANTDMSRGSPGYIYIVNLKTGALTKKIALDHNAIIGDVLAIDKEKDYISEKIYFGTAYYSSGWKGKLASIVIPNQDLSSAWTPTITYLFSDNYPFTASPDAAKDTQNTTWVYAGAGKYYSDVDDTDTSDRLFLGIKDATGITYPKTAAGLDNRTSTNVTGTVTGTTQVCLYDSSTNTFGFKTVVTSINPSTAPTASSSVGWYISLTSGERVISRPLAVGGLVDFLTYKPDTDPCSYGGDSYLYAVGYTTGVAPSNVAIQSPEITGGATSGTVTVSKGILLGPGAPPTGEAIIIPPQKEGQESLKKKIQVATGVIVEATNEPVTSVGSKILHWLRK